MVVDPLCCLAEKSDLLVRKFLPVVSLENQDLGSGPRGPLPGYTTFSNFDGPGVISKNKILVVPNNLLIFSIQVLEIRL